MSETGRIHGRTFKGHPSEAAAVRAWARQHTPHPDAPLIAHELYIALLGAGTDPIEMRVAVIEDRLRITATGTGAATDPLPVRHSHGPGWRIIHGLTHTNGVTIDERGLWAQLGGLS
jgi:hypothetical protein